MQKSSMLISLAASAWLGQAAFAWAAETVKSPDDIRVPGIASGWPSILQDGPDTARARQTLGKIKLPPGFHIGLYAMVPGARHMAVGPRTGALFVGTTGVRMYVATFGETAAAGVWEFAPGLRKNVPNGPCFAADGTLFVAEKNRIELFAAAESFTDGADLVASPVVPEGSLVPRSEESSVHSTRVCRIGPDNKLYVQLGQQYNVPPKNKVALYKSNGIGGIVRMDRDGKNREVFATGMRNPVGMDFNPKDRSLWTNDNQVDGMGDDIPPGEMNRVTRAGEDFGFPYYGGGRTRTNLYLKETPPADAIFPEVDQVAHAADLGLVFYSGDRFPAQYRGAIFSTQHGSWDRSVPVGARVMVTFLTADGHAAGPSIPFAEGWNDNGSYLGRPVDVAQGKDGSLLVSDDWTGAIYRIWYHGK